MALINRSILAIAAVAMSAAAGGCYKGNDPASSGGGSGSSGGSETGEVEMPPEEVDLVPASQSRRMTQSELDKSLGYLLGDFTEPAGYFLSEDQFTPFDNDYNLQLVSRTYVESMEVMAIDVAQRLVDDPQRRSAVVPCVPSGPGDTECFREFITSFGRLALRRPLTEAEIEAYATLQSFATEDNPAVDNDFYTAVKLVIQAIIQDPEFLYRLEVGTPTTEDGVYKLDDFEIASRVAFMLWGSTPDDQLIADAEAGRLSEPVDRAAVIDRVLADDRTRDQLHRYHAMWLGYRGIPHGPELIDAFSMETDALIDRVVFDDRQSYLDLFTMTETYVDDFLAGHYGLDLPAGGEGWVPSGEGRAGILSHGSVLSAFSKFTDTSPTQRGILVSERLQCIPIQPPPPNVDSDAPPGDPDDPTACKEQRYIAHMEQSGCVECHSLMDPIGMGLENYDIAGVFRATDEGKPECTISGQGELPGVGAFSGPGELGQRLVESGRLERCVVQHYLTYAYGRPPAPDEAQAIQRVTDDFTAEGQDFLQMMANYAGDELFGYRREPGT